MTDRQRRAWIPAVILGAGCLLNLSISAQRSMTLAAPLATVPQSLEGLSGTDVPISDAEARVAGVSSFVNRVYGGSAGQRLFIYVGYYSSQRQGKTIHSPKNCLPGAGWEPISSRRETLPAGGGTGIRVNRFVIAKDDQQAIVYYWYQGRGRTVANEYRVKLDLMRDAAIRHRSEEALVRIVVPVGDDPAAADDLARRAAVDIYGALIGILPS